MALVLPFVRKFGNPAAEVCAFGLRCQMRYGYVTTRKSLPGKVTFVSTRKHWPRIWGCDELGADC